MSHHDDHTSQVPGVRTKTTLGPRWHPFRDLNNEAIRLSAQGRLSEAEAMYEAAYRMTLVGDVDAAGWDARARALTNLAGLRETLGDVDSALTLSAEALAACGQALDQVGDRYGTRAVKASVLINRAQTLHRVGRLEDSLVDLDAALELATGGGQDNDDLLAFNLRNTKANTLTSLERWPEADTEARAALDLAMRHHPTLAGYPYTTLAIIMEATGDFAAAQQFLQLSADVNSIAGEESARASAIANLGRLAMRRGDFDAAADAFAQAEKSFLAGEQPGKVAQIQYSRGVLAINAGQFDTARQLLSEAAHGLDATGDASTLAECRGLLGDLLAFNGEFDDAEELHLTARRAHTAAGANFQAARVDGRRAVTRYLRAVNASTPDDQLRFLREAMDLALPAALATDAIRHRFAPGPTRERWVATVSEPVMSMVFALAVQLHDIALLWELIENVSATVSLQSEIQLNPLQIGLAQAFDSLETGQRFEPATDPVDLPFAAGAALITTDETQTFPVTGFGLPPRLRIDPDRSALLSDWIDRAEHRYGFPVRTREEINSW